MNFVFFVFLKDLGQNLVACVVSAISERTQKEREEEQASNLLKAWEAAE